MLSPRLAHTYMQVDMMLQLDGRVKTKCTCFMFVNPTPMSHKMLTRWEENIIRFAAVNDQVGPVL